MAHGIPTDQLLDMALAYVDDGVTLSEVAVRWRRPYVEVRAAFEEWNVPLRVQPHKRSLWPDAPSPDSEEERRRLTWRPRKPKRRPGQSADSHAEDVAAWAWAMSRVDAVRRPLFSFEREHEPGPNVWVRDRGSASGIKRQGKRSLMLMRRRDARPPYGFRGVHHDLEAAGLMGRLASGYVGRYWH